MDWKVALGILLAPIIGTWLYLKPAKYVHDYLWRNVKNETLRSLLFKKI